MIIAIREVGAVEVDLDEEVYLIITQTDAHGEKHVIAIPAEMSRLFTDAIEACLQAEIK